MLKQIRRVLSLFLTALMLCLTVFPASSEESSTAATIQLMRTEGTVSVANGSSRSLTTRDNMRLYNGYHVETSAKSYAWINLDDEKLTKLDEVSGVEVRKSGRKLELLLNEGNLFFNVTAPLAPDETLNIRTSTMAAGIRGTCGWVRVIDRWCTEVYILEGTVEISVMDPVTGQVKTETLRSGEKAVTRVYPQEQTGDKCDIIRDRFASGDIDGFVLVELLDDPGLCDDIHEASGIDVRDISRESARERLAQDQREMQDVLDRIDAGLARQDSNVSAGAVWNPGDSDAGTPTPSGGGGGGGGNNSRSYTMPLTATQVQDYLNESGVNRVTLLANDAPENPDDNTLKVDIAMSIPSGKTLTLSDGIDVAVDGDSSIAVSGTMTGTGSLTSGGDIRVDSPNTLRMASITVNEDGTLTNTGDGHIVSADIRIYGTLTNDGLIEGPVFSGNRSTLYMNGGEITSSDPNATVSGSNGRLVLNNGTITNTGNGYALEYSTVSPGNITFGSTAFRAKHSQVIKFVSPNPEGESDDYVPDGYVKAQEGTYYYVRPENGGSSYPDDGSILARLLNARAGDVIKLDKSYDEAVNAYETDVTGGSENNPIVLDLNGHRLSLTDDGYGLDLSGALRIVDTSAAGDGDLVMGYGIIPRNSGHLFLDRGTVSGKIMPQDDSIFTLTGGAFMGEITSYDSAAFIMTGGAVTGMCFIGESSAFNMSGGAIDGGGVYGYHTVLTVGDGATGIISGGTVTGHVSTTGNFTMRGGTVSGSIVNGKSGIFTLTGGEVAYNGYVDDAAIRFTDTSGVAARLTGGTVSNNTSGHALEFSGGGDVTIAGTVFRAKQSGIITFEGVEFEPDGYTATNTPDVNGYYYLRPESVASQSIIERLRGAYDGEVITLDRDYVEEIPDFYYLYITAGTAANPVVLDLSGYTLTLTTAEGVTYMPNAYVTGALLVRDSIGAGRGEWKLNLLNTVGQGCLFLDSGTLSCNIMNEGSVAVRGGTVNGIVSSYSTFTMTDGTVNGSIQTMGGSITMDGGTVNGGVYLGGDNSAFTMNAGTIINEAIDRIYIVSLDSNNSTFIMNGGDIIANNPHTAINDNYNFESKMIFNGGMVTNRGSGYAMYASDLSTTPAGTVFRAKNPEICVITDERGYLGEPWRPAGYAATDRPDSDGYYYLAPQPGATTGGFIVEGGTAGTDYSYSAADGVLTVLTDTQLTISNAEPGYTDSRIAISSDAPGADIILDGVHIDVSETADTAALLIPDDYAGNISVTLADGSENELISGANCAGLQKGGNSSDTGTLTIKGNGELIATGGLYSAGIGGGLREDGANITIAGGSVTATGGIQASGIGGGGNTVIDPAVDDIPTVGNGTNIKITGGIVTAFGGDGISGIGGGGAGIGGGYYGDGSGIEITGGKVTATGGNYGAGIGGGLNGDGSDITISGSSEVEANGGENGSGIGGGRGGDGYDINIAGGIVTANGGDGASYSGGAGIGGGYGHDGNNITIDYGTVTATGGGRAAGIGGGGGGEGSYITINGGEVTATGGSTYVGGAIYGSHITISGGEVTANGVNGGASIYGSYITVSGGTINGSITSTPSDFIMTGGEVISSSDYTVTVPYDPSMTFILSGGTITNNGTGYALFFSGSLPDSANITGTVFRAKQDGNFISYNNGSYDDSTWKPEGYTATTTPDGEGYYCLSPDTVTP